MRGGVVDAWRDKPGVRAQQRLRERPKTSAKDWMVRKHDETGSNEVLADGVQGQDGQESQPRRAIEECTISEWAFEVLGQQGSSAQHRGVDDGDGGEDRNDKSNQCNGPLLLPGD